MTRNRQRRTHAPSPTNEKVAWCREFATGAQPRKSGPIVGALNATCIRCQGLVAKAAAK